MRKLLLIITCMCLALFSLGLANAQEASLVRQDENMVIITAPLPASEAWGLGNVLGTAAVPGMKYYYLAYLPLNDDLSVPANTSWLPASAAMQQPVVDGILATIDTGAFEDGAYALRLVVVDANDVMYYYDVSPIRVNNARYNRIVAEIREQVRAELEAEPTPTPEPTPLPPDDTPRVFLTEEYTAANIRRCDVTNNEQCPIITTLKTGETAQALATSANGTGWYQVRLDTGLIGWISPVVVNTSGDFSQLPSVAPPPPLPPPPPPTSPKVVPNGISVQEGNPVCLEPFNVQVNVTNTGDATAEPGWVSLQDVNLRTAEITFGGYGEYPALEPGQNYVVVIEATVSAYYNEAHDLRARAGAEEISLNYILQQGNCP